MVGRFGTMYRTVVSALAAMIAAAAPSIAWAGDGDGKDATGGGQDTAAAEHRADAKEGKGEAKKPSKKAHAKKSTHAKAAPAAPSDKPDKPKPAKKTKKTASRAASKKGAEKKGTDAKAPPTSARGSAAAKPCFGPPVTLDRGGLETETLSLVTCSGTPLESSRARLSALARPFGAARDEAPAPSASRRGHARASAPGRLLDRGLAVRLDAIARHYPAHAISVVSGWRPKSRGSLHQSGRAIDVHVAGVTNAELASFCKTLRDTGCGFYPNSSFVHVDVRAPGTGMVSWIDASGPGEPPRYVREWPPRDDEGPAAPPTGDEAHEADASPGAFDPGAGDASRDEPDLATPRPHHAPSMGLSPSVFPAPVTPSLLR
jgi:hypothetical protein